MALESRLTINGSVGGVSINGVVSRSSEGILGQSPTLPAAQAGTMSRTSDTAGTLTMATGHGLLEGQVVDIYWATGCCYGATLGVVTVNSIPFTGAAGDAVPVGTATAVTVAVQTEIAAPFDGDLLLMLAAKCAKQAQVLFYASSSL